MKQFDYLQNPRPFFAVALGKQLVYQAEAAQVQIHGLSLDHNAKFATRYRIGSHPQC